jgi:hypothetical protein
VARIGDAGVPLKISVTGKSTKRGEFSICDFLAPVVYPRAKSASSKATAANLMITLTATILQQRFPNR